MKSYLIFASALLASNLVLAEGPAGVEGKGGPRGDRLQRMQEHLQLSDEQVEEIRAIRQSGGGRKQIHAILTDEQRQLLREHRAKRGGKGQGPPPAQDTDG